MSLKVISIPEDFIEILNNLNNNVSDAPITPEECKNCDDVTCENYCIDGNADVNKELIGERIFNAAKQIVNGHRQDDYGAPEDSFQNIANYWNAYLAQVIHKREEGLTAKDVALMMVLFKIARLGHGYTTDSVVDICGYAAIYANMHGD